MKKEIEINELIESYLKGILSEADREHVERRMQEDASFAQQVDLQRQLHQVISDSVYLDVKNNLRDLHLRKIRTSKTIRRITGFGSAGLIIGLVVLLVVLNAVKTDSPVAEEQPGVFDQTQASPPSGELPFADTLSKKAGELPFTDNTFGESGGPAPQDEEVISPAGTKADVSENEVPIPQPAPVEMENGMADEAAETKTDLPDQSMPQIEPQMPEVKVETAPLTDEPPAADCNEITIEASFTSNISCNNEPTGSIVIDRQSVRGGAPPYAFSLNQKIFTDTSVFSALYPGSYSLFARDINDCTSMLGTAIIGSEDCTYQAAFAPLRGETWIVPADENRIGTLFIYSKEGNVVYSIPVNGNETTVWSGETLSGQGLPMGLYQFEIRYDDGNRFIGNVTIVR